jgi:hypothetical protein
VSAEIIYLPIRDTDPAPSPHWLIFDAARQITGCACGFPADLDEDCGWGDSVVDHLLAVGK